ncbi:hypothetical protein JM83_3395 [Gillisia sp. Hel_I_86]|uniref:hypothetical protein n=1 Tax=Gillisia sp. Hel_I_86 TaxID=1249981 RepID=UPI00119C5F40|nr:hypothetical protein [Gillisia sp. Hel_I_86]TVZ28281.1 hypothetical protein JM83_3395 [Gillisia sp. Hel_I_86]
MKTVDKMEVLHSQTAEFILQGEIGKFLKLIPDTFIIKGSEQENGFNQGYAIRHINRKDILLIDVVEKETLKAVKQLVADGYTIKGIILSNSSVYKNAYADLKTVSEDAGGAPIYAHPRNSINDASYKPKDITAKQEIVKHFGLKIYDLPGNGGGSILIYSDINDGMLFTGEDAIGSNYNIEENTFSRPTMDSKNSEFGLAESWGAFEEPFSYLFPLHGKPGFNLEAGQQTDILNKLSRIQS